MFLVRVDNIAMLQRMVLNPLNLEPTVTIAMIKVMIDRVLNFHTSFIKTGFNLVICLIVSITKFPIVIGSPRAYLSRNRRAITWVSNYRCPIWKSSFGYHAVPLTITNIFVIAPNSNTFSDWRKTCDMDMSWVKTQQQQSCSLKPRQILWASRRKANDFFAVFFSCFELGGITKHLMIGPRETVRVSSIYSLHQ